MLWLSSYVVASVKLGLSDKLVPMFLVIFGLINVLCKSRQDISKDKLAIFSIWDGQSLDGAS